ncbi:SMP-30/gluconolactonase/LRE family protein [Microbacterium sp.]|uniref:SMP-30/gluconolactonase/LRE family protein n=1 Tax=Microbacterium sp. TaxID=51671 RepID=UPI003C73DC47
MSSELRVLVDGLTFLECPRWREGRLWISEMHDHRVITIDDEGAVETVHELDGDEPGGLGWTSEGELLLVSTKERKLLGLGARGVREVAALDGHLEARANDMVVDALGRSYIGSWGYDFEGGAPFAPANIAMVDADGGVTTAAKGLGFPNGMVVDEQSRRLIVAETMSSRLMAFRIADDGSLSDPTLWADLPGTMPDGICWDGSGGIWVADPGSRKVLRVLEGGEIAEVVQTEKLRPYACALGVVDGRKTLYICVAESFKPAVTRERRTGAVLALDVD